MKLVSIFGPFILTPGIFPFKFKLGPLILGPWNFRLDLYDAEPGIKPSSLNSFFGSFTLSFATLTFNLGPFISAPDIFPLKLKSGLLISEPSKFMFGDFILGPFKLIFPDVSIFGPFILTSGISPLKV